MLYSEDECTHISKSIFSALTLQKYREIFTHDTRYFISDLSTFQGYVEALENETPLQYVLGEAYFDNLRFEVSTDVLIPRPETNQLLDFASDYIRHHTKDNKENLVCLDLCTGSGCIAISLKKRHPSIRISGLDISEKALHIAEKNSLQLQANVEWIHCALESFVPRDLPIDLIISNPPYVEEEEYQQLSPQVKKEPKLALTAPPQRPLYFYELIALFGKTHLATDGIVCLEINEKKGEEVVDVFRENGYQEVRLEKDFFSKDRFVLARL